MLTYHQKTALELITTSRLSVVCQQVIAYSYRLCSKPLFFLRFALLFTTNEIDLILFSFKWPELNRGFKHQIVAGGGSLRNLVFSSFSSILSSLTFELSARFYL